MHVNQSINQSINRSNAINREQWTAGVVSQSVECNQSIGPINPAINGQIDQSITQWRSEARDQSMAIGEWPDWREWIGGVQSINRAINQCRWRRWKIVFITKSAELCQQTEITKGDESVGTMNRSGSETKLKLKFDVNEVRVPYSWIDCLNWLTDF